MVSDPGALFLGDLDAGYSGWRVGASAIRKDDLRPASVGRINRPRSSTSTSTARFKQQQNGFKQTVRATLSSSRLLGA
jgi:hypothetical protein